MEPLAGTQTMMGAAQLSVAVTTKVTLLLEPCPGSAFTTMFVEQVMLVLEGRSAELENRLLGKIRALADELRFEEAE